MSTDTLHRPPSLARREMLKGIFVCGCAPMLVATGTFASSRSTLHARPAPAALATRFEDFLQRWIPAGTVLSPLMLPSVRLELEVRRADGTPATGELIVLQTDTFRRDRHAPITASRAPLDGGSVALSLKFPITTQGSDTAAFDLFFREAGTVSGVRLSLDAMTCQAAHCLLSEKPAQLQARTLADMFFAGSVDAVHAVAPMTLQWRQGQARLQRTVQLPV